MYWLFNDNRLNGEIMAKNITLELHKDGNWLVLDSQDIYDYIGESTEQEIELAFYIDKWCEYLNYYAYSNKEMKFGDPFISRLEGWLAGYNQAKKIKIEETKEFVKIKMRGYDILLWRPFEI